jgi:hypothetical protein
LDKSLTCPYEIINHSFTKLAANLAVLSAMSNSGFTSATSKAISFSDFQNMTVKKQKSSVCKNAVISRSRNSWRNGSVENIHTNGEIKIIYRRNKFIYFLINFGRFSKKISSAKMYFIPN